ncbi:MAG: class I SAM-dependent methyltransferase [Flavobacterium sp.]|nr:MAG: class I SAM-dependent methyltransferase [Flavobacterium sp.]
MSAQIEYYDHFGEQYEEAILSCPEPHFWTTDYQDKGRIYQEIKQRVELQKTFIDRYFNKSLPVLDIGCGFGRQAYLLAKDGFQLIGIDTSKVFISLANSLFYNAELKGMFLCKNILEESLEARYQQVLLFDVLEHIPPRKRKLFIQRLSASTDPGACMILSLPSVKKRISSQINNCIRKAVTHHFSYFRKKEEHPYPIPQKGEILQLIHHSFTVKEFTSTNDTDYYVLARQ